LFQRYQKKMTDPLRASEIDATKDPFVDILEQWKTTVTIATNLVVEKYKQEMRKRRAQSAPTSQQPVANSDSKDQPVDPVKQLLGDFFAMRLHVRTIVLASASHRKQPPIAEPVSTSESNDSRLEDVFDDSSVHVRAPLFCWPFFLIFFRMLTRLLTTLISTTTLRSTRP